jgi:hypothetical protein
MTRAALAFGVGILAVAGIAAARHHEDAESVKPVAAYNIVEKLDGKDTTASAVEVTIEPGKAGVAHRHPGPGFGYILEGEYEWAIDDQPASRQTTITSISRRLAVLRSDPRRGRSFDPEPTSSTSSITSQPRSPA